MGTSIHERAREDNDEAGGDRFEASFEADIRTAGGRLHHPHEDAVGKVDDETEEGDHRGRRRSDQGRREREPCQGEDEGSREDGGEKTRWDEDAEDRRQHGSRRDLRGAAGGQGRGEDWREMLSEQVLERRGQGRETENGEVGKDEGEGARRSGIEGQGQDEAERERRESVLRPIESATEFGNEDHEQRSKERGTRSRDPDEDEYEGDGGDARPPLAQWPLQTDEDER